MDIGTQPQPSENDPVVAIYRAALPQVFGYLLPRCGSVALAEDLTGETFVAREQRGLAAIEREQGDVDDPWDEVFDLHAAHAALWRLPVPQRLALMLRYLTGCRCPR